MAPSRDSPAWLSAARSAKGYTLRDPLVTAPRCPSHGTAEGLGVGEQNADSG